MTHIHFLTSKYINPKWHQSKLLTVAFALLVGLVLVVGVDVFGLGDPVQVSLQILLQLLLLTQLLEVSTSFGLLSLLGKLSTMANEYERAWTHANWRCPNEHTHRHAFTAKITTLNGDVLNVPEAECCIFRMQIRACLCGPPPLEGDVHLWIITQLYLESTLNYLSLQLSVIVVYRKKF